MSLRADIKCYQFMLSKGEEIFIVFHKFFSATLDYQQNTWCVAGGNACCGEGLTFIDILLNIMRVSLLTFIFQFPRVWNHTNNVQCMRK
jgi:hypothetical protein